MPLDGVMLGFVARELNVKLMDGRVDRVIQPEKDELHLIIRAQGENHRLVLSASPGAPRVHLTVHAKTGPLEPPTFCMLLRKHLTGGRVSSVRRIAGDRILRIDFAVLNELGDLVTRTLVTELMGRHSNVILLTEDGRIIDAIRHVGEDVSRVRLVLPGLPYQSPPSQGKIDPDTCSIQQIATRLSVQDGKLANAIVAAISGFSPQAALEAAARIGMDSDASISSLDVMEVASRLYAYLHTLPTRSPCVVTLTDEGIPSDVFPFPQIHLFSQTESYSSASAALDAFFFERDLRDRLNQRASGLRRTIRTHIERCKRKIVLQNEAIEGGARMEEVRQYGELLQANLYRLKKGIPFAEVENYFSPDCEPVRIPMDISLSPAQNAQRYFKLYQKARGARTQAMEQKESALHELAYLEQMEDDLRKCSDMKELNELRVMLEASGHIRATAARVKPRREAPSKPMKFLSCDGIEIEVGKNALQNERITMNAAADETWLHAQKMPGSHVIIHSKNVPDSTLHEAAMLAAYYSKGMHSAQVPVDITLRRHIKKPSGTPAGFVTYTHQRTLYITPDEMAVRKMKMIRE